MVSCKRMIATVVCEVLVLGDGHSLCVCMGMGISCCHIGEGSQSPSARARRNQS